MGPLGNYGKNIKIVKNFGGNMDYRKMFICNNMQQFIGSISIRNLDWFQLMRDVTNSRTIDTYVSKATLEKKMLFSAIARLHCGLNNINLNFLP